MKKRSASLLLTAGEHVELRLEEARTWLERTGEGTPDSQCIKTAIDLLLSALEWKAVEATEKRNRVSARSKKRKR